MVSLKMACENMIVLLDAKLYEDRLVLYFNRSDFYIWLENTNKHILEVYELTQINDNAFVFYFSNLPAGYVQSSLKLSLSDNTDRLYYFIDDQVSEAPLKEDMDVYFKVNEQELVCVINRCSKPILQNDFLECGNYKIVGDRANSTEQINYIDAPVKIGVIGTCFSRSIFRSDEYFNPDYKKYFTVPLTLFHSSLISLMSMRHADQEYLLINDLLPDQVFRYIEVEFQKNIKELISLSEVEYLIIDNYSDATHKVIEMNDNNMLTYNRYFAESIYKRKFSGKNSFTPGSEQHIIQYRESVRDFYSWLQTMNLDKKIILLGCRLSVFRSGTELWQSKMDWINKVNSNLDIYDSIFLEECSCAQYIDMRSTNWISDVNTPIVGGASPSHYQSEFYKEIYEKIKKVIFKG